MRAKSKLVIFIHSVGALADVNEVPQNIPWITEYKQQKIALEVQRGVCQVTCVKRALLSQESHQVGPQTIFF